MTKKIVAVNCSPRAKWNTAQLVRAAAEGAVDAGAEVEVVDLYKLEPFMGCRSCFACKLPNTYGKCIFKDGLAETLEKLRECDGMILGSPNYFGRPTAGFRALYERLVFQYLTYRLEPRNCNDHPVPVLFIMTSNCPEEGYEMTGYDEMMAEHEMTLRNFIGPVTTFVSGDTYQTDRYDKFNWTMFDDAAKLKRHEEVFPQELAQVRELAASIF